MPSLALCLSPSALALPVGTKKKMDGQLRPYGTTNRLSCDTHVAGVRSVMLTLVPYNISGVFNVHSTNPKKNADADN